MFCHHSSDLFNLVCGITFYFIVISDLRSIKNIYIYITNGFLVFYIRVLVLACLPNSSLKYRGPHPCMHLKVKVLNSILFLMSSQ